MRYVVFKQKTCFFLMHFCFEIGLDWLTILYSGTFHFPMLSNSYFKHDYRGFFMPENRSCFYDYKGINGCNL